MIDPGFALTKDAFTFCLENVAPPSPITLYPTTSYPRSLAIFIVFAQVYNTHNILKGEI